MRDYASTFRSRRAVWHIDMNLVEITNGGAPERGCRLMTGERAGRRDVQSRGRHLAYSDLYSGSDIKPVEPSLEVPAAEIHVGESSVERFGTGKWL
jgi:hypothetical protein